MTDATELIEISVGAPLTADGGPLTESIHIQRYGLGWVVLCIMVKPGAKLMRRFERAPVNLAVDQEGGALWWYLRIPRIIDWSAVPWPWQSTRSAATRPPVAS